MALSRLIIRIASVATATGVNVVLAGQELLVSQGTISVPAAAGFAVTDVDLDETVFDGQTGVVITITGTVVATGKKVFITQGANSVEQTVTAEDASSATITVSYGGVLSAGAATLSVRNPL